MNRRVLIAACLAALPTISFCDETVARKWNEALLDAIRIDTPAPTVHSRNLFHTSVGMYEAWAAYDETVVGVIHNEKITPTGDIEASRNEAISYAAYRILKARFSAFLSPPGHEASQASFDTLMDALGYDRNFASTDGDTPAALGNRIAQTILSYGLTDGGNEAGAYEDDTGYQPANESLVFDLPGTFMHDPNRWQPLSFDFFVLQNGIVVGQATQAFLGPHWGFVKPFALVRGDPGDPYVWSSVDPGQPPQLGGADDQQFKDEVVSVIRHSSRLTPDDGVMMNASPAVLGNRALGTHQDVGYANNPATGLVYEPNMIKRGDYGRILAEFWADGPSSETPPGHWNTIANYVTDHPALQKRFRGVGPIIDDLEWEVKLYLALNGAVHDAAIAAWGAKAVYDYVRPISAIRHMGGLGQSTDPAGASYDPSGLPLVPGLIEVITDATSMPGERHSELADHIDEIAIYAWVGQPDDPETEYSGVGWIRAVEWLPYQRDTFVTPPFAGYVSGHSTFSRAGTEVLSLFTGSTYFPGGLGTWDFPMDVSLEFEIGPTEPVQLQWATYYDAADEAGISRLWGGIHVAADDFQGRIMGSTLGIQAFARAESYFNGTATPIGWRYGYDEWLADNTGEFAGETDPMDSPSNDGIPNLLKFVFAIDPAGGGSDRSGLPVTSTVTVNTGNDDQDHLALVFDLPERFPDVDLVLETSNDGSNWDAIPWLIAPKSLVPSGDGTIRVTVRDPTALEQLGGSRFLRIRVK